MYRIFSRPDGSGDVEFIDGTGDGSVKVRLNGACGSCPMAQMTLKVGIEKYLRKKIHGGRWVTTL